MTERIEEQFFDTAIAKLVAEQVEEALSKACDTEERILILKAFIAAAVFGYAEMTSLANSAQWLRCAAEHIEGLAHRRKGRVN